MHDACYYWVEASFNAIQGDFMYVQITSLSNVRAFVSIKADITD